jgi:hypothetical protein
MLRTWDRDGYLQAPKLKKVMERKNSKVAIFPKKIMKKVKIKSDTEIGFFDNFYGNFFPKLGEQYELIKYVFSSNLMYLGLGSVGYTTVPTTETVKILHEDLWTTVGC